MKTIYTSIFIALLTISASAATASEFEINDETMNFKEIVEPRFQMTLFPGIARPAKKPLAMHMVETPRDNANLLNLNSSLVNSTNSVKPDTYLDDIEVVNNNIFELRF
ncbi:MAG: hypothetical protein GKR92_11695 [Gammaproteobacteria bacterium]|nr:MAG: hypothetical protein GKR92_11695 [Gammaproteobacteria bacterium]